MSHPPTRCPVAHVEPIDVDQHQLEPLLAHLDVAPREPATRRFPRGTLLADGRLDLCKQRLGAAGVAQVIARVAPPIRSLLVGTNAVGDEGAQAIADDLPDSELETLYLGCNHIGPDGADALAEGVAKTSSLRALWLKRNPLGLGGAKRLVRMLGQAPDLEVLDVFNCELGDEGVALLLHAVAEHPSLEHLYLGANGAGGHSLDALGPALERNRSLRTLQLTLSDLDGWVAPLAAALQTSQLHHIELASCGLTQADALLQAASEHPTLRGLGLGYARSTSALEGTSNQLGDAGAATLAAHLSTSRLQSLDLSHNGVRSRGAWPLMEAVEAGSLCWLRVGRGVAKVIRRRIRAALARNRQRLGLPEVAALPPHVRDIQSVYR